MFANDPTLYGATIPPREFPLVNPFFTQWQQPQLPWQNFGRFIPPTYQEFFPPQQFQLPTMQPFYGKEFLPQLQFPLPTMQPFFGNRIVNQLPYFTPYMPNFNLPQARWQFPFVH